MNKKISTLMAAALVAGGMSANAQVQGTVATELFSTPARNYMLSTAKFTADNIGTVISVDGKEAKATPATATDVNKQLWTLTVKTVAGSNRFVLVNKAEGITLSFDPKSAIAADASGKVAAPAAGSKAYSLEEVSSDTEWTWVSAPNATSELDDVVAIKNAFRADSTMAVATDATGKLYAYKYANNKAVTLAGGNQLTLQAVQPGKIYMTPDLLNVLGETTKYFTLSTNKSGMIDQGELIGRKFHAVTGSTTNSVKLQNLKADGSADNKFAYVDTTFHVGTGTNKDVWYKLANTDKVGEFNYLASAAMDFFIEKDLYRDSVVVSVAEAALKEYSTTADVNGSFWQTGQSDPTIRDYKTVSAIKLTPTTEVLTLYAAPKEENLLFAVSSPEADNTLTTVDDGVYTIKNDKGQYLAVPVYNAYNEYDGYPTWVTVKETEQNVAHMPAYQWVVLKDRATGKGSETSAVTLTNREFAKKIVWDPSGSSIVDADYSAIQLRQKEGGKYMYSATYEALFNSADSVKFEPIDKTILSDTLLGYKNLEEKDLQVNRYTFNYLHPYTRTKFIAKSAKDSLLTVLDGKAIFAIKATEEIQDYGFDVEKAGKRIEGLKQLRRQAYQLSIPAAKTAQFGFNNEGKYAVSSTLPPVTFFFKENNELKDQNGDCYHAMIHLTTYGSDDYWSYSKAGVADDDLDATLKNIVSNEKRTSAFKIAPYDAPLYRRFNSEKLEGNAGDASDTLRFKQTYRDEYLQVEANESFTRKGIDFLGIYTQDYSKDGKSFIVDTAFVDRFNGNIKPQYLISIDRKDKNKIEGVPCTYAHNHYDNAGNKVSAENCSHAEAAIPGYRFGKYLVNFADSTDNAVNKAAYNWKGYTRAGFVKAAHVGDSLYILTHQFANITSETFKAADIIKAVADKKYDAKYIVNLVDDKDDKGKSKNNADDHKLVTWSMRFANPEKAANEAEEDREFLMESQSADGNAIAPSKGQWLKMQNGCIALSGTAGAESTFDQMTGDDDALVFIVEQGSKEDFATENEKATVSEVSVIAGQGQVTIAGAAGKKVVISNILGQTITNTVIASDNAVIAVPTGVVVVAVDGEEAVKAIVK